VKAVTLLLLGCTKDDPVTQPTGDSTVATDSGDSSIDTAEDLPPWQALTGDCSAPADLGADTLVYEGGHQITSKKGDGPSTLFIELVDLEKDGDVVYGVGQGGLILFDFSDVSEVSEFAVYPDPDDGFPGRFHRVEKIGEGAVALVHRDFELRFADVSDPSNPVLLRDDLGGGREGLAAVGDRLYVSNRSQGGTLEVWDVSDLTDIVELDSHEGFGPNTWELSKTDDGWLYAADQSLGVLPISLADKDSPEAGQPVGDYAVQHIDVEGDALYAAMGSAGVGVFDRSDPAAPVLVTTLAVAGSAVQVAADGDYLFAADHEGLVAWDISDPLSPVAVGHQVSEQFALAVINEGATAWLGDWSIAGQWALTPGAPELALSNDLIQLPTDGGSTKVSLTNYGQGDLEIVGATGPEGVTLEMRRTTLESGASTNLQLSWTGGELDDTICLATNDPDEPLREITVVSGDNGGLGGPAPDFTLNDLDGNSWRLSEQLGHPVVLAYFATW